MTFFLCMYNFCISLLHQTLYPLFWKNLLFAILINVYFTTSHVTGYTCARTFLWSASIWLKVATKRGRSCGSFNGFLPPNSSNFCSIWSSDDFNLISWLGLGRFLNTSDYKQQKWANDIYSFCTKCDISNTFLTFFSICSNIDFTGQRLLFSHSNLITSNRCSTRLFHSRWFHREEIAQHSLLSFGRFCLRFLFLRNIRSGACDSSSTATWLWLRLCVKETR